MKNIELLLPKVKHVSSKTLGSEIESFRPITELPPDYDTWEEPIIDYINIKDLSELNQYLSDWFKEHPEIPKDWLKVSGISSSSLIKEKIKSANFIQIYVDSPEEIWCCIHMNHQVIGKLPISYDRKEVENIIKDFIDVI